MGTIALVIAYGCCVGSIEKLEKYVRPHTAGPLIALYDQSSIAEAYNKIIDIVQDMDNVDALVLQHDDLEITDQNFVSKMLDAMTSDVALIGVAGGKNAQTLAWWDYETTGHQQTDSGMLTFTEPTGDVEVLEGSILILTPWSIRHLRFDERYGGFHGYDDIGYEAVACGKRVIVVDADTYHHTSLGWKSQDNFDAWSMANDKFREKWNR